MLILSLCSLILSATPGVYPIVDIDEDVYTFESPNNGSGPLWSYGCTQIVRDGTAAIISQMETGKDVPPHCNTRWRILRREASGWKALAEADDYRQREPCPMGIIGQTVFMNVNESMRSRGAQYETCWPYLYKFNFHASPLQLATIQPEWPGKPFFTDHSYRGFGVDAARGELLMMNVDNATTLNQVWCHLSAAGTTIKSGTIHFPQRGCYSQIALNNRAAHIMAISDWVEPVEEWRNYKKEQTGRDWDYVFRVLNYTWTPDIASQPFSPLVEIANVEATGGHISNQDLYIDPDGRAYVMYTQREVQSALLRDKFLPGKSVLSDLHLAIVKEGRVVERHVLHSGTDEEQVGHARFHSMADGSVIAVLFISGKDQRNGIMPIWPVIRESEIVKIPLAKPFYSYCVASVRAGNAPSDILDIFGHCKDGNTLSYAKVLLK